MNRKIYKSISCAKQGVFALALTVLSGTSFAQTTYTFNYTGSTQTINLPAGNYSIECWGADGGDANNGSVPMLGGKGGYASGIFSNSAAGIFNIYVGGKGGNASGGTYVAAGGGGMSDIAPASNTIAPIVVAGGGGGATSGSASEASTGGDGGGLTGGTAVDGTGVTGGSPATGGSQTAGGFATAGSYGAGNPGGVGHGGGGSNGGSDGVMHGPGGAGGFGGTGGWNGGAGSATLTGINDHAGGGGAGYYGGGGGRGDGGAGGGGSGYIGGLSTGTTVMSGQAGFVSNPDLAGNGMVLIRELCSISLSVTGLNSIGTMCPGKTVTITTNAIGNYTWTDGSNAPFLVVSPGTSTVYGLTATSPSNCISSSQVSIDVSPAPSINVTNNTPVVCLGSKAVISVSGADTYSWNINTTAANLTVVPSQNTTYTVTGTYTLSNCSTTQTVSVDVISPTVSISGNNTICAGGTTTLTANSSAATSFSWSTGLPIQSILVSPSNHTIYVVTAQVQTLNVTCSAINSIQVTVNSNPNIVVVANRTNMCVKESVAITAGGGTSYAWTWGTQTSSAPAISITPSVTSNIIVNVTGTGANGCTNTGSVAIVVDACTGIDEVSRLDIFQVYPNPSAGSFNIALGSAAEVLLISETGQVIRKIGLNEENGYKASVEGLSNGIYFIMCQNGEKRINKKVVVNR